MQNKKELGRRGEQIAVEYLVKKGHSIIHTNYVFDRAEVDVISHVGNLIVFTEVKTRSGIHFGYPEEAVTIQKEKQISKVATHYIEKHQIDKEVRFDIVSIILKKGDIHIEHIQDAFFPID